MVLRFSSGTFPTAFGAIALSACSLLVDLEQKSNGVDAGLERDATGMGMGSEGSVAKDASLYDGPSTFCSSKNSAFFCDDYDRPTESAGYVAATPESSTQSLTTVFPFSAPSSRRFSLPARSIGYAHSLWFVPLPKATLKSATVEIRFRLSGGLDDLAPMDLVGITTQGKDSQNSDLFFSVAKTGSKVTAFNSDYGVVDSETSLAFSAMKEGEWHRLILTIVYPGTNVAGTINAIVDGKQETMAFAARRTTGYIVFFGARQYTAVPLSAADVYLDDAVLNIEQ
jgi:hypothetical protein